MYSCCRRMYSIKKHKFSDTYTASNEIKNSHINIGTGEEISIFNLAELIKEVINYKGSFYLINLNLMEF